MLICRICLLQTTAVRRSAVRRDACAAATRSIVPSVALRQLHDGSPERSLLYAFKFDNRAEKARIAAQRACSLSKSETYGVIGLTARDAVPIYVLVLAPVRH